MNSGSHIPLNTIGCPILNAFFAFRVGYHKPQPAISPSAQTQTRVQMWVRVQMRVPHPKRVLCV